MGAQTTLHAPAAGSRPRRPVRDPGHEARGGAEVRPWTINGDFLSLKPTGVARFGREMTVALDALIDEDHPLTRDLDLRIVAPLEPAQPLPLRRIPLTVVPELKPRLPQVWIQLQLPRHLRGGLLSFCNLAPVRTNHQIVCIHDLQTRTTPESYGYLFRLMHRVILPNLGRHVDAVTTVSESSKAHIVRLGVAPACNVAVVHNGSDHVRRWFPERSVLPWTPERPFVLCIGRDESHKNMELIWRLAGPLDEAGIDIVVAGDFDPLRLNTGGDDTPPNIRCLGRISDDQLARCFADALCFLFPSRTEGFGLPAIEAMACGCPVVASVAPCLPEICGNGAVFADPDDVEGWITAICRLRDHPQARSDLRGEGLAQARRYSWRNAALHYLGLMHHIDARRSHHGGRRSS